MSVPNKSRTASWDDDSKNSSHSSYGWFEDFESPSRDNERNNSTNSSHNNWNNNKLSIKQLLKLRPPLSEIPQCISESSLATQVLWYNTAGQRPIQPKEEREYFERLWSQNFEKSDAVKHYNYQPIRHESPGLSDINGEILYKGNVPFSHSVSKSFMGNDIANMTLQIPTFRIIKADHSVHAEFLIIICINGISLGVWRRHSNFQKLAETLQFNDSNSQFKNAILSWKCLVHRKRWYKSLDSDYLAIKCFLFERFLHDILFESHSPLLIINFLSFHFIIRILAVYGDNLTDFCVFLRASAGIERWDSYPDQSAKLTYKLCEEVLVVLQGTSERWVKTSLKRYHSRLSDGRKFVMKLFATLQAILYELQPIRYSDLLVFSTQALKVTQALFRLVVFTFIPWTISTIRSITFDILLCALISLVLHRFNRIGELQVFTCLFIIYLILKNMSYEKNETGISAYSVFNKGFRRLLGQLTAEQFDREIRHMNI